MDSLDDSLDDLSGSMEPAASEDASEDIGTSNLDSSSDSPDVLDSAESAGSEDVGVSDLDSLDALDSPEPAVSEDDGEGASENESASSLDSLDSQSESFSLDDEVEGVGELLQKEEEEALFNRVLERAGEAPEEELSLSDQDAAEPSFLKEVSDGDEEVSFHSSSDQSRDLSDAFDQESVAAVALEGESSKQNDLSSIENDSISAAENQFAEDSFVEDSFAGSSSAEDPLAGSLSAESPSAENPSVEETGTLSDEEDLQETLVDPGRDDTAGSGLKRGEMVSRIKLSPFGERVDDSHLRSSSSLGEALEKVKELKKENALFREENQELAAAAETLRDKIDDYKKIAEEADQKYTYLEESFQDERQVLSEAIKEKARELAQKEEQMREKEVLLKTLKKQNRQHERELENRLEIIKSEGSAVKNFKDQTIMKLRREIDELKSELEDSRKQAKDIRSQLDGRQKDIRKVAKTLRLALTRLEVDISYDEIKKAD